MAGNSKKGEGAIICVHIKKALHVIKSNSHFLFLFYFTFPQQTTLLLLTTSSFLKSCPLLASTTCHIPKFSSTSPALTWQSYWFFSVRLSSPFTLSSLSGGNVFTFITSWFKNIYLQPSLVPDPMSMQHLQISISECPHAQQCNVQNQYIQTLFQDLLFTGAHIRNLEVSSKHLSSSTFYHSIPK